MIEAEVWLNGFLAIAAGLVIGGIVVARLIKRGAAGVDLEMQLNDIDEQLEHMVAQLRDLEQQRERSAEAYYVEEKALYEGKAAALMRERDVVVGRLEELGPDAEAIEAEPTRKPKKASAEVTPAVGFFSARPQLTGALWGAGIVLVVGGLFWSVSTEQTARAPGGSMTGNTQPGQVPNDRPTPKNPQLAAMMERLEKNPDDIDALNNMTRQLLFGQMFNEASQLNNKVLSLDGENLLGLTYAAVLKAARGDPAAAKQDLEDLIEKNPKHADGHFFRGMMAMQSGDRAVARESWARFVEFAPPSPRRDRIQKMLESMPN
ncbi:MAG: hypothetical protein AAF654_11375 [Myxococcota bacterium]